MNLVYVIAEVDRKTGEINGLKIGKSTIAQLPYRLRNLQTGNRNILTIVHTKLWQAAFELENNAHEKFHANRVADDNEWFEGIDVETVAEYLESQTVSSSEDSAVVVRVLEPEPNQYLR